MGGGGSGHDNVLFKSTSILLGINRDAVVQRPTRMMMKKMMLGLDARGVATAVIVVVVVVVVRRPGPRPRRRRHHRRIVVVAPGGACCCMVWCG